MGTICILLAFIFFLGSIFLGFAGANALIAFPEILAFVGLTTMQTYIAIVGVCAFIGFLLFLNLLMLGLTYNKVCKLARRR